MLELPRSNSHHQDYETFLVGNPEPKLYLWLLITDITGCGVDFFFGGGGGGGKDCKWL